MPPSRRTDSRTNQRKSLFAAGVLKSTSGVWPVRIRNISATGALVEASSLPKAGLSVRLCRASLWINAEIRWVGDGRAGLLFEGCVDVAAWLRSCAVRGHQERVDEMIDEVRASPGVAVPAHKEFLDSPDATARIVAILGQLEEIASNLSASGNLMPQYAIELQTLDICIAELRRIISSP